MELSLNLAKTTVSKKVGQFLLENLSTKEEAEFLQLILDGGRIDSRKKDASILLINIITSLTVNSDGNSQGEDDGNP